MTHLHIGYGDSATACLNEAILNHGLPGVKAIPSRDDFTQGPIPQHSNITDFQVRISYWESLYQVLGYHQDVRKFFLESIRLLQNLQADQITLWVGDSCHDLLATAWLLAFLKEQQSDWQMIDLAKLPEALLPNGEAVVNVALYSPHELSTLYEYRQPLSQEKIKAFANLWDMASKTNSTYRIKENDKIRAVDEDYFDTHILSFLSSDFIPATKVIGNILIDNPFNLSDTTIEWNIRKMIRDGRVAYQGTLASFKDYSIRKK